MILHYQSEAMRLFMRYDVNLAAHHHRRAHKVGPTHGHCDSPRPSNHGGTHCEIRWRSTPISHHIRVYPVHPHGCQSQAGCNMPSSFPVLDVKSSCSTPPLGLTWGNLVRSNHDEQSHTFCSLTCSRYNTYIFKNKLQRLQAYRVIVVAQLWRPSSV